MRVELEKRKELFFTRAPSEELPTFRKENVRTWELSQQNPFFVLIKVSVFVLRARTFCQIVHGNSIFRDRDFIVSSLIDQCVKNINHPMNKY